MKRKLLLAYFLVLLSFLAPAELTVPQHEGLTRPSSYDLVPKVKAEYSTQKQLDIVPVTPKQIAYSISKDKGWSDKEWDALVHLWGNESGWNTNAVNPTSGACGIVQAWPCSKIGSNWRDPETQLRWGINYIAERYGSPSQALSFWYSQCGSPQGCWY